jgi:hypothetical protein
LNELGEWYEKNELYLTSALTWLRLRMDCLAVVGNTQKREQDSCTVLLDSSHDESEGSVQLASDGLQGDQIEKAEKAMIEAEGADPLPALIVLSQKLGLSRFEQNTLLLCAAMELDTRIPYLYAKAQGDINRPYPTFALAMALFDEPAWDMLSPERPLRYWRLIEINQPATQPLITSPLRADERIVSFLKGLNYIDDRIASMLIPAEPAEKAAETYNDLPPSQDETAKKILRYLGGNGGQPPVIQLLGSDMPTKLIIARHVSAELGLYLYRLQIQMLPTQADDLENFSRLWQRESILLPIALYIEAHEEGTSGQAVPHSALLNRFLAITNGIFFLDSIDARPDLGRTNITLDILKPTASEQLSAWASAIGHISDEIPSKLASQFDLNHESINQIARRVRSEVDETDPAFCTRLWDEAIESARPRLETLAQRLNCKATWEDIVLPAKEMNLLRQIAGQMALRCKVYDDWGFREKMNRGLGISVLFTGDSGTGKTMAAEVLANALRLDLYRIDLSAVVSKYIGETEKNLRRLFDAAEDGGAILFFDEADALFGKRSEVKDSHDRYANIEINYLLQRIEAYRGLAILATNMKSALDTAFMRRLRFVVTFSFPGAAERMDIWRKVFPAGTPTEDLDLDKLAGLNIPGGSIHRIALNASFLAAGEGTPVTMPLILDAAKTEFYKMEMPVNESDFNWPQGGGM